MRKRIISTIGFILLVAVMFAVVCFLSSCQRTPGTLPKPKELPKADRSDIGTTVSVSMESLLAQEPGDVKTVQYAYVYNNATKTGRLAVFTHYEHEKPVSMLTVYEPEWTGVEALLPSFEGSFQAKIVDRAIISSEERHYLYMASYRLSDKEDMKAEEILDPAEPSVPDGEALYYCFGYLSNKRDDLKCHETKNGSYLVLIGNKEEGASSSITTAINSLKRTAERFDLEKAFGLQ